MPLRLPFVTGFWTLADQTMVSAGTFLVNIILARQLPAAEYGVFTLLYSVLLTLQVVNLALIFYPLSVRGAVASQTAEDNGFATLAGHALLLTLLSALAGAAVILPAAAILGRPDLALPAMLYFLLWQGQEAMRRGLFAQLRHRAALPGDMVSQLGQVAIILVMAWHGPLGLAAVLQAMALTSAAAAVIQFHQLPMLLRNPGGLARTAGQFWHTGRFAFANTMVLLLRVQAFPWMLAAIGGPGAAAGFQALLNLVNLSNPVIIGLGNAIPQVAARGRRHGGNRQAWQAVRGFMIAGAMPLMAYYAAVLTAPGLLLHLFYGAGSPYLELTAPLRLLVLAWLISYTAEMVCSYLHGIDQTHRALAINATGTLVAFAAAPLVAWFGILGAAAAVVMANIARTMLSHHHLQQVGHMAAPPT